MAHPEEYPNERISNLSVFKSISILFPRARAAGDPIKYRSSLVTVSAVSQYHTPSIEHIALEFQFFIRYELGYFMVIYQMVSLSVCACAAQRPRGGFHLHRRYSVLRTTAVVAVADTAPSKIPRREGYVACCTVHRHRRFGVHVGQTVSAAAAGRHQDGPPPPLLHNLPRPNSRPAEVGAAAPLVEATRATLLVAPKAARRVRAGPLRACYALHFHRHYSRTTEAWPKVKTAASGCGCATAEGGKGVGVLPCIHASGRRAQAGL
jgi:hypothetical protein